MSDILAFTDGASRGNPGPAGWGAVMATSSRVVELGGAIREGTNNQAELQAVVAVVDWLIKDEGSTGADTLTVYSDSSYTISGAEGWLHGWKARGWKTKTGDPVKNKELWQTYDKLQKKADFNIQFHKVKGHASIPGNERADDIATMFADGDTPDLYDAGREGYQVSLNPEPQYLEGSPLYFSLIDGVVKKHASWEDCQKRVKGKSAKYKKVRTISERDELLDDWGVALEQVRK